MESSISGRKGSERTSPGFTESEAAFLAEGMLGRVATVSRSGQPHVVPVAYRFDGSSVYFGGWDFQRSLKFRNLTANNRVAFVVDDVVSTRPWKARGVEIRGRAKLESGGGDAPLVKIMPLTVRSWGLED
jgi:pyridoxamine 5'-phosphate oxidase family protein